MKLYPQLLLGLVILVSCQKQKTLIFNEGPVIVEGQIENASNKTILISALELTGGVNHVAKIDTNGCFRFSINVLSAHDNFLHYGGDLVSIFLEPNDSLYFSADGSNFEKTIKYAGKNAKFNQSLQMFFVEFRNVLESEKFFEKKRDLAPNEFKAFASDFFGKMDSKLDSITKIVQPDKDAVAWMNAYLKYRLAEDLIEYGKHHEKDLPPDYFDFEIDFLQFCCFVLRAHLAPFQISIFLETSLLYLLFYHHDISYNIYLYSSYMLYVYFFSKTVYDFH